MKVELSNTDKIFFPDSGITKGDLIDYYRRVAETMLPHLADRPATLQRFPDGIPGEGFFQKDASDYFPDWIRTAQLDKQGGTVRHVVCNDADTLVYLANQATVTLHIGLSRVDDIHRPDRMVFDFDPPDGGQEAVRFAARAARDLLEELDLESFLMTTGSRGFHVVVPLRREQHFDEVRGFAHAVARALAEREPDRLTLTRRKSERSGRIFIDYLRNGYAQTAVAPYSVRARRGAPVATPLAWDELTSDVTSDRYTLRNIFRRLSQTGDPWANIDRHRQRLKQQALDGLGLRRED